MDKHIFLLDTESEYKSLNYEEPHIALTEDDGKVHYDKIKIIVNGYEFVDLGLSINWATCNIGAESPEEYGWYFQWGGTAPYNSDLKYAIGSSTSKISFGWNSYCALLYSGTTSNTVRWRKYTTIDSHSPTWVADNKTILEPEDDATHVHIGGESRMPTEEEYQELINACDITWITDYNGTGINGRLFTLKTDPSNTLFFPAAGDLSGTGWYGARAVGYYWSSSLYSYNSLYGVGLEFDSDKCSIRNKDRYLGYSIRAVLPK